MTKLTNLATEAQKITLSPQEKAFMRSHIFDVPAATPRYAVSHFQFFSIKFAPVLAGLLIVLLGGGTAYAAQAALPGELLYAVKVNVNEPVREALAVSTEAKAAFHANIAETRLEEAEALAAEGKLNASTSAEIEKRLETHLARAEEIKIKLEEEEKEDLAVEVEAELESALSAHSAILAKLGEESEDEETKEHSSSLAGRITSRIFARADVGAESVILLKVAAPDMMEEMSFMAADATSTTDVSLMATNTATSQFAASNTEQGKGDERAAASLRVKAKQTLADAQETFEDLKPNLEATTTARVEAQFKTLEEQIAEGETLYEEKSYSAARMTFSAALRDTTELHAYLRAEKKFNKKYLLSWIDNRFGAWFEAEVRGFHVDDSREDEDKDHDDEEEQRKRKEKNSTNEKSKEGSTSSSVKVEVRLGL